MTAVLVAMPLVGICAPHSAVLRDEHGLPDSGNEFAAFSTSAGSSADDADHPAPSLPNPIEAACAGFSCGPQTGNEPSTAEPDAARSDGVPWTYSEPDASGAWGDTTPGAGVANPRSGSLPTTLSVAAADFIGSPFFSEPGRGNPLYMGFEDGRPTTGLDGPVPGENGVPPDDIASGEIPTIPPGEFPPAIGGPLPDAGPVGEPAAAASLPEPAPFALLGVGLLGLALVTRHKAGRHRTGR